MYIIFSLYEKVAYASNAENKVLPVKDMRHVYPERPLSVQGLYYVEPACT